VNRVKRILPEQINSRTKYKFQIRSALTSLVRAVHGGLIRGESDNDSMSDDYRKLERRVAALEESVRRLETKNRGYLTQTKAAQYIGRSNEFLRERAARGDGPARLPNGMYSYADLDEWMHREVKYEWLDLIGAPAA